MTESQSGVEAQQRLVATRPVRANMFTIPFQGCWWMMFHENRTLFFPGPYVISTSKNMVFINGMPKASPYISGYLLSIEFSTADVPLVHGYIKPVRQNKRLLSLHQFVRSLQVNQLQVDDHNLVMPGNP